MDRQEIRERATALHNALVGKFHEYYSVQNYVATAGIILETLRFLDDLNHTNGTNDIGSKLDRIVSVLQTLVEKETTVAAELDALKAEVARNTEVDQSAIALLTGLHEKLAAAIASGDPAQLVTLRDSLQASTQALADAVTANTPAE